MEHEKEKIWDIHVSSKEDKERVKKMLKEVELFTFLGYDVEVCAKTKVVKIIGKLIWSGAD